MDENRIQSILDRYWQGETSLEEEAQLKAYFQGDDVADEHAPFKPFFDFLTEEQEIRLPGHIDLPGAGEAEPKDRVIRLWPARRWVGVAATLAILIGFFWIINLNGDTRQNDTYENPELALEQAKEALFFLSYKMDKGAKSTTEQIKQLEKLSVFN